MPYINTRFTYLLTYFQVLFRDAFYQHNELRVNELYCRQQCHNAFAVLR